MRFGLSGLVFTILGPGIFWLTYPLGVFVALAVAELLVHAVRFGTFRKLVFPAQKGYTVSLTRYVASTLPITCAGFASVALLQNHMDRTSLTVAGAVISMVLGFVWSQFVYSHPVKQAKNLVPGGRPGPY